MKDNAYRQDIVTRICGATLYQKMEIMDIFGAAFPPRVAIEVKFCTAKADRRARPPCQV